MKPTDVSNSGNLIAAPVQQWMDHLLDKGASEREVVLSVMATAKCSLMVFACLKDAEDKGMGTDPMLEQVTKMAEAKFRDRARLKRLKDEKAHRTVHQEAKIAAAKVRRRLKQERRVRQV